MSLSFINENFLLNTKISRLLYHEYAKNMPIFDYHCHLCPKEIANNYRFSNLYDIWLRGDHYKWRAMRTHGIPERFCTGQETSDYEKFKCWSATVPYTIGNPLYHWTHLELYRLLGISGQLLSPSTSKSIWNSCNKLIQSGSLSSQEIIKKMRVKLIVTTDDPLDSLEFHQKLSQNQSRFFTVLPGWRPDKILDIEGLNFKEYTLKLGELSDIEIRNFCDLKVALRKRMSHFSSNGCVVSDHALSTVTFSDYHEEEIDKILKKRLDNTALKNNEISQFKTALLVWLGSEYAHRGWVQQYHIGALRNNNRRKLESIGTDSGFDSINDRPFAQELALLLNKQNEYDLLPKTVIYCLNPSDNEVISSMIGNFQDGDKGPSKMQFGCGWWFNDQKDGITRQIEQLSQMSLLRHFIGMTTDSRSFLSYVRHEYFRRILCRIIGRWATEDEIPQDIPLLGEMVKDICFNNASRYFRIKLN